MTDSMKDLNENEKQLLLKATCPDCESIHTLMKGPRGGLSTNIECSKCSAKFNVAIISHGLIIGQRLENRTT